MSQSDIRSFGIKPQHHAGNPLPFSPVGSIDPGGSLETLSDVGPGCVSGQIAATEQPANAPSLTCCDGSHGADRRNEDRTGEPSRQHQQGAISVEKCQHFSESSEPTPETCNTGVSIRHLGGLDTLEVSLYGYWHPCSWHPLKIELDAAKARAEAGVEGAYVVSSEGDELEVGPTGCRKGVFCRWVLQWNGCTIAIVNNMAPSEHRLSVHVTIGSLRLMEVGHDVAWQSVTDLLRCLGYEHDREVVGRADLCTDHADRSMDEVEQSIDEKRLICKARKSKRFENADNLETYVRGTGALLVRIYDKAVECKNDPIKRAVMIANRWGKACDHAVRVEFQLRNKALQRFFSVKTVAELFAALGAISKWCTSEWFRIVNEFDRKNRNHARATVSEFWSEVQQQFSDWCGTALPRCPKPRTLVPDFKQLKEQAVGCVSSIVAHADGDFMANWIEIGEELVEKAKESIPIKRRKLEAAHRALFPDLADVPF